MSRLAKLSRAALLAALLPNGCTLANAIEVCDRGAPTEQGSNALPEGDQAVTHDRAVVAWAPGRAYLAFGSQVGTGYALRTTFIGADGSTVPPCGNDAEAEATLTEVMPRAGIAAPSAANQPGLLAFADQDGGVWRVFAQYVRSDGCFAGGPLMVGQELPNEVVLEAPGVVGLGDGLFLVVWTVTRVEGGLPVANSVRARLLRGNEAIGHVEFAGHAHSLAGDAADLRPVAFRARGVAATSLGEAGAALLWYEIGSLDVTLVFSVVDLRLQQPVAVEIFASAMGGLRVPEPPEPSLAFDGTQLLAAWVIEDERGRTRVMARFLTADGQALRSRDAPGGEAFSLHPDGEGDQRSPSVIALSRGGFLVVFEEEGIDGDGTGIGGVVFTSDGTRQFVNLTCDGSVFVVNQISTGDQSRPSATELADGTVLVSWTDASRSGRDVSGTAVQTIALSPRTLFPEE